MKSTPDLPGLLAETHWLRGLAASLARQDAERDDLVQETWLAALRTPPAPGRPPRPWLGEVMRNVWRMAARGARRRRAREAAEPVVPAMAMPTDELLLRAQTQRLLADLVLGLDEPYRSSILLFYYEGRTAKQIAAELGVPAGTVRWRITEGVARLRRQLEARAGGDPVRARGWVLGLAGTGRSEPAPAALADARRSVAAMPRAAWWLAGAGVGLGVALGLWRLAPAPAPLATSPAPRPVEQQLPSTRRPSPSLPTTPKEEAMNQNLKRTAAFLGVAMPALLASAEAGGRELDRDEHIAFCVERWEKIASCADAFAAYFSGKVPPARREQHQRKFVAQAQQAGTGPIEARRERCADSVDRIAPTLTRADVQRSRVCFAAGDCAAMVACMKPILDQAPAKKPAR